jgi:hypothetical protein
VYVFTEKHWPLSEKKMQMLASGSQSKVQIKFEKRREEPEFWKDPTQH